MASNRATLPFINKLLPQTKPKAVQANITLANFAQDIALHANTDKAADPVSHRMLAKAASTATKEQSREAQRHGITSPVDDGSVIINTWFDACNATANNTDVFTDVSKQKKGDNGVTFTVW